MNMSSQIYRAIVVASLLFGLCAGLIDVVFPQVVPISLSRAYDDWLGGLPSGSFSILLFFVPAVIVASLVATIGLCFFKSWARPLAMGTTIAALPLYPLAGPVLQSGWASLFIYLSALCWGAAIALAYTIPIEVRFEAKS